MDREGWPLGLEPLHLRSRILEAAAVRDDQENRGVKVSITSYSDETSNLETESTCSSNFFPEDKPVTLGEILGMSLNHLATNSFRSIELHVLDSCKRGDHHRGGRRSSGRHYNPWSLMSRCRCTRASTSSSRFDEETVMSRISLSVERIYTNSIFEHDGAVAAAAAQQEEEQQQQYREEEEEEEEEEATTAACGGGDDDKNVVSLFRSACDHHGAATENPLFLLDYVSVESGRQHLGHHPRGRLGFSAAAPSAVQAARAGIQQRQQA